MVKLGMINIVFSCFFYALLTLLSWDELDVNPPVQAHRSQRLRMEPIIGVQQRDENDKNNYIR